MKINRTYSIDHWIAVELQKKPNQSRFVNDAIKNKLDGGSKTLEEAGVRSLMIFLKNHKDCDQFTKRLMESALKR